MKNFNQLVTKILLTIFLSTIKTKGAIKFPKKLFFFFPAESQLAAERVKLLKLPNNFSEFLLVPRRTTRHLGVKVRATSHVGESLG